MPEGPSIVILRNEIRKFKGKKILKATGYAQIDKRQLTHQKVVDVKTWGKHLLICLPKLTIRVHLMLFGSISIDEKTSASPKLSLIFSNGEFHLYVCSIKIIKEDLDEVYDWSVDIMNKKWSGEKAREKLKAKPGMLVCDAILDQTIFAGAGNIFKNEVLFRIRVHPASKVGKLPPRKLSALVKQVHLYSFQFLKWKKADVLSAHWKVHTKETCPRCDIPLVKKPMGKGKRRTFFCENCQVLYK